METIAQKLKNNRPKTVYQEAAHLFNASYVYVAQIAAGRRSGASGKGKEIKEWLESQLKSNNGKITTNNNDKKNRNLE